MVRDYDSERSCKCSMKRTHKHSQIMGISKGTELGLVRCPKCSIRGTLEEKVPLLKKGEFEEEKKGIKRKSSYFSMETHSACYLDSKPTFSVEL